MKLLICSMSFTLIISLVSSCSNTQADQKKNLQEATEAIAASNAVYFTSFVKNEPQIFIDRYAKDCCIMAPGIPAMCGEHAAADFYKAAFEQIGVRNGKFTTTAIFPGDGTYVTEEGRFELHDSTNAIMERGKYLVLWKKTDAGWKMFRDSFSSDLSRP